MGVVHVDGNDFADYKAAAFWGGREIQNLIEPAFKTNGGRGYARDLDYLRRCRGNLSQFELIDRGVILAARFVHCLGEIVGDDVDYKFFCLSDVPQGVL